jgi:hypothetical protein
MNQYVNNFYRDKAIPLYVWIKQEGSINQLPTKQRLKHTILGWDIAIEVLNKYYKLTNKKPNRQDKIIHTAAIRYNSTANFILNNFYHVDGVLPKCLQ